MRATLAAEIAAVLRERGPMRSTDIALAVKARRDDVDETLAQGAFVVAERPDGAEPRATYWNVSDLVPETHGGGHAPTLDTDYLAWALRDGKWHTIDEILAASQRERGHGLTVHSRAADLRRQLRPSGKTVEQKSRRGGRRVTSAYRIVPLDESGTPAGSAALPARPEPDSSNGILQIFPRRPGGYSELEAA